MRPERELEEFPLLEDDVFADVERVEEDFETPDEWDELMLLELFELLVDVRVAAELRFVLIVLVVLFADVDGLVVVVWRLETAVLDVLLDEVDGRTDDVDCFEEEEVVFPVIVLVVLFADVDGLVVVVWRLETAVLDVLLDEVDGRTDDVDCFEEEEVVFPVIVLVVLFADVDGRIVPVLVAALTLLDGLFALDGRTVVPLPFCVFVEPGRLFPPAELPEPGRLLPETPAPPLPAVSLVLLCPLLSTRPLFAVEVMVCPLPYAPWLNLSRIPDETDVFLLEYPVPFPP